MTLQQYVGRIVRLTEDAYRLKIRLPRPDGTAPENRFLVATVSREMNKLICYGSGLCIAVCSTDVVLL